MLGGFHFIIMFLRHIVTKYGKDEYEATVVKTMHTVKLSYTTVIVSFCFGSGGHTTPASELIIYFDVHEF